MELTYITIIILSSMVFVLAAMVGYLYWQQSRMMQHLQSLSVVVSTQLVRQQPEAESEPEPLQAQAQSEEEVETEVETDVEEEDDRVSVEDKVEVVEGPPSNEVDVDDLQTKSSAELKELLTKKGIPFGKRDSKTVLLQLLKATN
jgi:membrane protein implicated in regulation of membrane protease activity